MKLEDIEKLIDEYGNIVYKFCIKISRNKEDAEDLYQQTFLKAVELRKKIRKDKNPKSFLISIAVKLNSNHVRKALRRNIIAPTINIDEYEYLVIEDNKSNVESEIINKEIKQEVNLIVSELPDKFKLPVIMYYTVGMSVDEISTVLKIPKGTVKSRLYKARVIIKSELEGSVYERL